MSDNHKYVILTIDDEKVIRESFRNYLEDFDYNVIEAENGRLGLEAFEESSPDLVLVDMRMPEMDGLEVLASIREKSPDTPIIVVSGAGVISDVVEALRLGAWDYILKPIQDMSILHHAVEKALDRARLIKENRKYQEHLEELVESRTEELRLLNAQLEEKVAQRTSELEESLENLKITQKQMILTAQMAALGELVAGVAHEVNTPVGIGITAASYMGEQSHSLRKVYSDEKLTRTELEKYIDLIEDSSSTILINLNRAAELIQSFKQVAVDQSSESKRPFNLCNYINEILSSLKPKLKRTKHKINVDCTDDLEINSFPGAFAQIFTNLLINSLIHGFEDEISEGEINIVSSFEGNILTLEYRDNGKGMNQEQQDKIFTPFFTTKRGRGGTGLGMNIVYNLVTITLKGEISCESKPGEGTSFFMTIPLDKEDIKQPNTQ